MHLHKISLYIENFRFALRKSNKENRLSKGYYFYGNESYLAISFWSGTDWKNKTPNIILVFIPTEKRAYLEICVSDSPEKLEFIKNYVLKSDLGIVAKGTKFYKPLTGANYIDILDNFIANEKKIIDEILIKNEFFFIATNAENRIGFIDADLFKYRLSRVFQYREDKMLNLIKDDPCYTNEINIKNYNGIHELSIDNIPNNTQWIFFTGMNGSGKTSILRALTLALCPNVKEYLDFEEPGHFKILVKLHVGKSIINVVSEASRLQSKNISKGFAAYGPSRLIISDSHTKKRIQVSELKRKQSASYSIFHPDGILLDFFEEFKKLSKLSKDIKVKEKIQIIIETLIECIDPLENILFEQNYFTEEINHNKEQNILFTEKDEDGFLFPSVKYFQLSSGTKSLIAMIGDMMIRLFETQQDVYDIGELKGIVLIDEIDIHFHPKQQRSLIVALTNSFPKVQFIVTTHSPIPLLGAPENSVFMHVKRTRQKGVQVEKLDISIKNLLPNTILSSPIFNFLNITSVNHIRGKDKINTELFYEEAVKNISKRIELKEIANKLENNRKNDL